MPLGIFVLAIDRRGKSLDRVVVGRTHIVKQLPVLVSTTLDLGHQVSLHNGDTYVLTHRTDDLFFVGRIRLTCSFFAQEYGTDDLTADDQRDEQLEPSAVKAGIIHLKKRQYLGLRDLDRDQAACHKLPFILGAQHHTQRKIVTEASHGKHVELVSKPGITGHCTAHDPQRTRDQVQRRTNGLLKIVLVGDLVTEICERPKRVDQLMIVFRH